MVMFGNDFWLFVENEEIDNKASSFGKWLLFFPWDDAWNNWKKIAIAVEDNLLSASSAKISRQHKNNQNKNAVVCVYTYLDNIQIIREQLRNLGFRESLCYKANAQTEKLLYGHFSHYICESKKMAFTFNCAGRNDKVISEENR